jgi:hypothetical protein
MSDGVSAFTRMPSLIARKHHDSSHCRTNHRFSRCRDLRGIRCNVEDHAAAALAHGRKGGAAHEDRAHRLEREDCLQLLNWNILEQGRRSWSDRRAEQDINPAECRNNLGADTLCIGGTVRVACQKTNVNQRMLFCHKCLRSCSPFRIAAHECNFAYARRGELERGGQPDAGCATGNQN